MAELTFPSGLASKQLPTTYGNPGIDEAALLGVYGRGIRGDPGIMLPQIMQARRLRQANDDAVLAQTNQSNAQNERMYNDFMPRAEAAEQLKQGVDLYGKGMPGMAIGSLQKILNPAAAGAVGAVDEQRFMKNEAEIDKTGSEAINQRATAANNADQAGISLPSALIRLGNFQKGLSRQERVQQIENQGRLAQEQVKADNAGKPSYKIEPNEFGGGFKEQFTGRNPKQVKQMFDESRQSDMPALNRPGAATMNNLTGATKKIDQVIQQQGAQIVSKTQSAQGSKIILHYRVKTKDGATRDLEYEVDGAGNPTLRKR